MRHLRTVLIVRSFQSVRQGDNAHARDCLQMMANDRVERPATMPMPRPDAAHHASRSAPTRC
jgi:hypothetical protein